MTGFAGLERDTVTGLNLAVYREENPTTARWDSLDPLGFASGTSNLFGYTSNDSPNSVDPSGLGPVLVTGGSTGLEIRPNNHGSGTFTWTLPDGGVMAITIRRPRPRPRRRPERAELPFGIPDLFAGAHCQYDNGDEAPEGNDTDVEVGLGDGLGGTLNMGQGPGYGLSGGGPFSGLSDPLGTPPGLVIGGTIPDPTRLGPQMLGPGGKGPGNPLPMYSPPAFDIPPGFTLLPDQSPPPASPHIVGPYDFPWDWVIRWLKGR